MRPSWVEDDKVVLAIAVDVTGKGRSCCASSRCVSRARRSRRPGKNVEPCSVQVPRQPPVRVVAEVTRCGPCDEWSLSVNEVAVLVSFRPKVVRIVRKDPRGKNLRG